MTEGSQHQNAVAILKGFVISINGRVFENNNDRGLGGFKFPMMMTEKGPKEWTADVYTEIPLVLETGSIIKPRIIIEADGDKAGQGHNTPHAKADDEFRDKTFLDYFGTPTLRYPTPWLVGRQPVTQADFLKDLLWKFTGEKKQV